MNCTQVPVPTTKVSSEEKEKIRDCNLDIRETDLYPVFEKAIDDFYKSIEKLHTK